MYDVYTNAWRAVKGGGDPYQWMWGELYTLAVHLRHLNRWAAKVDWSDKGGKELRVEVTALRRQLRDLGAQFERLAGP